MGVEFRLSPEDESSMLVESSTGKAWDLSDGILIAESVFEALEDEAGMYLSEEEREQELAWAAADPEGLKKHILAGAAALKAAAHDMPPHGTLRQRLQAVRDGFFAPEFPDRVQVLLEAASQQE